MIKGIDIKEVWDYRLSMAIPMIVLEDGTWVVKIYSKTNPDYVPAHMINQEFEQLRDSVDELYDGPAIEGTGTLVPETKPAEPLETHDTGIKVVDGDIGDVNKIKVCYEWLKSVRDKYSLDNIEELKPVVKTINEANRKLAEMGAA